MIFHARLVGVNGVEKEQDFDVTLDSADFAEHRRVAWNEAHEDMDPVRTGKWVEVTPAPEPAHAPGFVQQAQEKP